MARIGTATARLTYHLAFTGAQIVFQCFDYTFSLFVRSEHHRRIGLMWNDPGRVVPYFQGRNYRQRRWRHSRVER